MRVEYEIEGGGARTPVGVMCVDFEFLGEVVPWCSMWMKDGAVQGGCESGDGQGESDRV